MKKKTRVIIESIIIAIFIALIIISLVFATGAVANATFAVKFEYLIQKKFALYDFDIVNTSTIVAIVSAALLIMGLTLVDNKFKVKKKKIVRR